MPQKLRRRTVLTSGTALALARPALAQSKPERLVFVGDPGAWKKILNTEQASTFEKETGIRVEITQLPIDALNARLRSEFASGGSEIDIVQWTNGWTGWVHRYLEDHKKLLAGPSKITPDWDWNDFLAPALQMGQFEGVQLGVPYRATVNVLHYQKALLEQAGFAEPPKTFDQLRDAAIACTKGGAPNRYGMGLFGKEGAAIVGGFQSILLSAGGGAYDPKTWEIFINDEASVTALQFYGDLVTKWKVTPPEVTTWEFDEIMAGGQNDRYAMADMLAPFGSQINDPRLSKTAGKWAWAQTPGLTAELAGRAWIGAWTFSVPTTSKNKEWAGEFIKYVTSKPAMLRSMDSGNLPPRNSVLNDPEILKTYGWAAASAVALSHAIQNPSDEVWGTMEARLRTGISQVLLGQRTAKVALDAVADDWRRSLRRAGLVK
jgi:ABC-type glycerol-3-phosphate transport system substrate-binding protein